MTKSKLPADDKPIDPELILRALGCAFMHGAENSMMMKDIPHMIFIRHEVKKGRISG
jgi:hypothetical protein